MFHYRVKIKVLGAGWVQRRAYRVAGWESGAFNVSHKKDRGGIVIY